MGILTLGVSKGLLAITNFFLLVCGFTLVSGGLLLLFDSDRVLLSKLLVSGVQANLRYPLLYYASIGITLMGCVLAMTGVLGCWASCMHSYCMLTLYFLIIILVLIFECVLFATIWAWPNCLGLVLDPYELTKSVQGRFGKESEEEFTAAVDLAQTMFQCCGIESANEYDTSLWRLQSLSHSLAVPLTCCKLSNFNDTKSYLNPIPMNTSLCQALEVSRHEKYRHLKGCQPALEKWYTDQYMILFAAGLILVLVEFMVLLTTLLNCAKIYQYKQERKEASVGARTPPTMKPNTRQNEEFHRRSPLAAYSNESYALSDSFRQNYKLVDSV
ncbi:CD151 antigen [Harmonia axyridis]|uniref:CD151 antigen n=1 Tax=Harmonia axyridis TaxID=115357 RepID=UPI001E275864|nr:CD151 antigen [Harmonia axyridis]